MKSKIFKYVLLLTLTIGLFSSCINSDIYPTPDQILTTYEFTPTVTVAQVKAANPTANAVLYTADDVLEGYVTSNDKESNFYNSTSFQSVPTDGTQPAGSVLIGFSISANVKSFTKGFVPGRKAYIKLKGLYTAFVDGSLKIGALYNGGIGRISENEWQNYMFPSATIIPENNLITLVTLTEAANDTKLNLLLDVHDVQFAEGSLNRTYYDVDSGGGATNHDIISTTGGSTEFFRISSFAPFSKHIVASGSGTLRGVMTKYGSDYQFLVRDESDVKLTQPRVAIHSPLGGTALTYTGSLSEPFTTYAVATKVFPNYVNDQTTGDRYWAVKQYPTGTGNKYIEMSSYGNPGVTARAYFFVPVDFTAANNFTFKKEIRYMAGQTLKVYYVTAANYTASGPINVGSFVDITSSFSLAYPATGSSDNAFSSAGTYTIPASVMGNGFFVFEYLGTPTVTTTIQLDDITIN